MISTAYIASNQLSVWDIAQKTYAALLILHHWQSVDVFDRQSFQVGLYQDW